MPDIKSITVTVCSSSSSSSSVDQLDAGRRPLCPIHYVDPFINQIKSI